MFGKLNQLGQMGGKGAALAKMAMKQRQIVKKKFSVEEDGVKVTVTGDFKIKHLEIDGEKRFDVAKLVNEAVKKAQEYSAAEMQGMMGDMGKIFGN